MKNQFVILTAAFLLSVTGHAYYENPNIYPLGEKEAFMANTGVALSGSSGAVFFNPAGLAGVQNSKVSLSANSYLSIKTSFSPLDVVDNSDINLDANSLVAVPSSVVSVQKLENWTLAFSVLVPEQTQLNSMTTHETTNFNTQIIMNVRSQLLLFGLSGATKHANGYDYGTGCFIATLNGTSDRSVVAEPKPATGLPQSGIASDSYTVQVTGLVCNAGFQTNYTDNLRVGANLRLPFIQTSGSGKLFSYSQSAAGGAATNSGIQSISVDYQIPMDLAFGASYKLTEAVQLYADASYQFPLDYKSSSLAATNIKSDGTLRWNAGASYMQNEALKFYGGFALNPGTASIQNTGDINEDFTVFTLGTEWVNKIATTGVGLMMANSTGESELSTGNKGSVKTNVFGVLLSAGFSF
jgi:hypothetical protein